MGLTVSLRTSRYARGVRIVLDGKVRGRVFDAWQSETFFPDLYSPEDWADLLWGMSSLGAIPLTSRKWVIREVLKKLEARDT